ncbi:hypothetical protein Tco_0670927 [Tanacetum coccineum]
MEEATDSGSAALSESDPFIHLFNSIGAAKVDPYKPWGLHHEPVGSRSEFYANSPLEAEAKAIWWAIQHATSRCYPEVVFEEGNMVAHSIARWALGCTTDMVLEGDVPSCASGLVSKDIVLFVY